MRTRTADPAPRVARARTARLQGQWLTALHEAQWALALDAGCQPALLERARAGARLGHRRAAAWLDRYFEAGGDHFDAWVARARLRWAAGAAQAAIADLDRALALKPDVDAGLLRARWSGERGDWAGAAAGLAALLIRLEDAELVRRALVEAELRRDPEAALRLTDGVLAARPDSVDWRLLRARALRALGRPDAADRTLQAALQQINRALKSRTTPMKLTQRAELRLALHDDPGARADLHAVLRTSPAYPKAVDLASRLSPPLTPEDLPR